MRGTTAAAWRTIWLPSPGDHSTECEVYSINTALSVCTFLSSCEIYNFSCSHCDVTTRQLSPRSGLLSTVQGGRWTQLEDRGYSCPASTSPGAWSVITPVMSLPVYFTGEWSRRDLGRGRGGLISLDSTK